MTLILGKTNNKGQKLYGRAICHKDIQLCSLGALSFYLMWRFQLTGEFNHPDFDWSNNAGWFKLKLLVDLHRTDYESLTTPMKSNSYSKSIKDVLRYLNISAGHFVHLGRVLGSKILEMLEIESEEIRRLGNWNPKIQEQSYSTKLPMKPIRQLAGYTQSNGLFYNKRTIVDPPDELLKETPIGGWVYSALETVTLANIEGAGKYMAYNFLLFMVELNKVFLQDTAAMMVLHGDRGTIRCFSTSPVSKEKLLG